MNTKHTNFRILLQDLKISYRFALKNIISFILGTIGVLIVTGLLIALLAAVIVPIIILAIGFEQFALTFITLASGTTSIYGAAIVGIVAAIITPIIAPMLVAMGALFGMGREIVESEGTTAQGVFAWYKSKFLPLAGGGIVMFLLAILPVGLIFILAGPVVFMNPTSAGISILAAGGVVYLTLVMGFLSMVFPAIIDGHSVLDAIRESIRMSTKYFDRVFSVWISFIGIAAVLTIPFWLTPFIMQSGALVAGAFGLYGLVSILFLMLIHFPATVIGLSRVYMVLSGIDGARQHDTEPEVQLVGDV